PRPCAGGPARRARRGGRAPPRYDRRCARAGTRDGGRDPDPGQAGRLDGSLARREPVPSGRGPSGGGRLRRLAGASRGDGGRRHHPLSARRGEMARGTQHRKRRPRPSAHAVAQPAPRPRKAKRSAPSWEDQLFFSRLKRHAKWVFVALAIAFAAGFVFFGVGSGSTGITDIMQNFFSRSSSGSTSLSALQKKTAKHPKVAANWRALATKLEQEQKTERAIIALEHYTKLEPKDESSLEELAGLYSRRASDYYTLYSNIANQNQLVGAESIFRPA